MSDGVKTSALKFNWGDKILNLPRETLVKALPNANEAALKVLILAAALEDKRDDSEALKNELSSRLDYTIGAVERAIEFWSSAGVVAIDKAPETAENPNPSENEPEKAPKKLQSAELPGYSEGDCADIIARSHDLAGVIDLSQQILGKMFTPADTAVIVGLHDHLRLDGDYIVTLVKYCADKGKKSLRYIERCALTLFDDGITSGEAFGAYLKHREDVESSLARLRRLTGASERELTSKEKKLYTCWLDDWSFDIEVIRRAWEVTVDKIGKPELNYINKVLENWHNSGFKTLADVEASLEAYKKNKAAAQHSTQTVGATESGFETDEIMEAILRRSCAQ